VHLVFFLSIKACKAIRVTDYQRSRNASFPFHTSEVTQYATIHVSCEEDQESVNIGFSKLDDSGGIHALVSFLYVVAVCKLPLR
jgi:hypothetical protein